MANTIRIGLVLGVLGVAISCGGGGGGGDTPPTVTTGGSSVVTRTGSIPAGAICPSGGVTIDIGIDDNKNGTLDPAEIDTIQYVCNGENGPNGQSALIFVSSEPAGSNCANGGFKVQAGLDANDNAMLDPSEVTSTQYACNGATGATGPSIPAIQSMTSIGNPAGPGSLITVMVAAQSPGDLALTYAWSTSPTWTIVSGQTSTVAIIEAPNAYGESSFVTVAVTDSQSRVAQVMIAVSTERNNDPSILSLSASSNPIQKNTTATISANALDPNGDTLSYNWSVPSGFVIQSGQGTGQISVLAQQYASGSVQVVVADGYGGQATSQITIGSTDGSWRAPTLVESENAGNADAPKIAFDPFGNAIAVWRQSDGTRNNIWADRYVAGTGWGTPTLLESDNGAADNPQIVMGPGGNGIAVWQQSDGAAMHIWANRYVAAAGWAGPVLIESSTRDSGSPQIGIDSSGNAIVVWHSQEGTPSTYYSIWACRYVAGSGWEAPAVIESTSYDAGFPEIAVNSAGDAVVAWQQATITQYDIWAINYVAGTGWGAATFLEASYGSYPKVAIAPSGNAIAIWEKNIAGRRSIASAYYSPGTGWGPVTLVETDDSTDKFSPKIAIDMNGMAIASWYEVNTVAINTFTQGAGWGTPAAFDFNAANATTPKVVFDPQGHALAVYGATFTRSGIYARRYVAGTGWDAAYTLISSGNDNAASEDIALDLHGNGIAVWAQWDGARYNIWSSDFR